MNKCDCGFSEDDLEFCENGIVYSDIFRGIQESPCNCICHGNVVALRPKPAVKPPCSECGTTGTHKMDCSKPYWDGVKERELVAA